MKHSILTLLYTLCNENSFLCLFPRAAAAAENESPGFEAFLQRDEIHNYLAPITDCVITTNQERQQRSEDRA